MSAENFNLYAHFDRQFEAHADDELLCTGDGRSYQYVDIARVSGGLAHYLTSIGLEPGDRVSVQVEKSPEALCLYLACLRAGLIFQPLNTAYPAVELEYLLGDAEPAVVVCDPTNESAITPLAAAVGAYRTLTLDADGNGTLIDRAKHSPPGFGIAQSSAADVAALLYSSGTTGKPKGIMLTHANLLSNAETLVHAWGFTNRDRLLHALPIHHVHGLFVAIGCVLLSGASMRWLARFDVDAVMHHLAECTVFMGVPTYYTRLLAHKAFNAKVAENMRVFISGSAPLLEETFREFEARTGHRILERYGMTETNMNTSNPLDGERKPGTVGPPLPGIEVRVTDDDGNNVTNGEIGNLQVRGPNVFVGYWKMPEKTAEEFSADGFFNTGDKARIDDDGYVSIVGRAKDMVITGGLNVYPKEIELFVDDLPGVCESAVIGVPHVDFGECVVAVVVLDDANALSEDDVIGACKAGLANFKVPKRVLLIDELPRNAMAKVQKNVLRKTYRDLFA